MSPADCLKRFGIYGSLIHGPLVHLWLSAITRLLPGTTPFLVLVKVVTDQVPFSLFFRFLAEVACILFLLTGNICACHIHLLLSRPGTFGGAEDWLVRPLAREGTHRVGQILFVWLKKLQFVHPLLSNYFQGAPSLGHKHLCLAILGCFQLQLPARSPATPLFIHLLVIWTSYDQ